MTESLLADLVKSDSLSAVIEEVCHITVLMGPHIDFSTVKSAFAMTVDLYQGHFPGYQACNTEYHDLRHTTDTLLAMARLMHGAIVSGKQFTDRQILISLISALLHDCGYILEESDNEGTGAKYTALHVDRSMAFLGRFGAELNLRPQEIVDGQQIIRCTDLAADISSIRFSSPQIELIGKMLGVADLFAQMADRTYLEKLTYLYKEFKEGQIGDYKSEIDLLEKTVGFYDFIDARIRDTLDGTDRFMRAHFRKRWSIDADLYHRSIANQKTYLKAILSYSDTFDPRILLKRKQVPSKFHRQSRS